MIDLNCATASQLASLLSWDIAAAPWTPADETAMWQQFLKAPLLPELERFGAKTHVLEAACRIALPEIRAISDLIGHPTPPQSVLDAVRRLSKLHASAPEGQNSSSSSMASVLYYAILATGVIAGLNITKLPKEDLLSGIGWAQNQPWLDSSTRDVFSRALAML